MPPTAAPRVALFTDSYYEANGVARTAAALEAFAWMRDRPLLVVHGGESTQLIESGSVVRLELARAPDVRQAGARSAIGPRVLAPYPPSGAGAALVPP